MKQFIVRTMIATFTGLLAFSASAIADSWKSVVINHEEQFTDGGGENRSVIVESISYNTRKLGNFAIQDLMSRVTIGGQKRTVIYSVVSKNQFNITVLGNTPEERISFNVLTEDQNLMQGGKKNGWTWVMEYGNEQLVGVQGGGAQSARTGTDPISFAALTAHSVMIKEVAQKLKLDNDDAEAAESTLKILGGLFGPRVAGRVKCSKKKIEFVSCTAHCVADANNECSCSCLGIPCCAECVSSKEVRWEYEVAGNLG